MSAYEVRRIDELDEVPVARAGIVWRPIRRPLGITAFGINAYMGNEGEHVVEEHDESQLGHEEVYVVIAGRARFTVGGDDVDVDAGGFVYLRDPATARGAVALEDGTTVLAIGGKPGQHEISAWEYFFAAYPRAEAGDYEGARTLMRDYVLISMKDTQEAMSGIEQTYAVTDGNFTYVSIDDNGRPQPVTPDGVIAT